MKILYFAILILGLISCNPQPEINDAVDLDGNQLFDLSLTQPEKFLASHYIPFPTEAQKDTPVIVCAHGYTATTFEWQELRNWADSLGGFYVSQVLLGGHGRTYEDFKASTWDEWQSSIREEYEALSSKGFRNIWLVGSSTGVPLILQMVEAGYFKGKTTPKGIFLIDPIVISSNKQLTMVGLLGPVLGYTSITMTEGEAGQWYTYRPQETLKQLMSLIDKTRKDLQSGMTLPENTYLKVWKSTSDDAADPAGAVLLYKGLRKSDGTRVAVEMMDSKLHVFTRLVGREDLVEKDYQNQRETYREMISLMKGN